MVHIRKEWISYFIYHTFCNNVNGLRNLIFYLSKERKNKFLKLSTFRFDKIFDIKLFDKFFSLFDFQIFSIPYMWMIFSHTFLTSCGLFWRAVLVDTERYDWTIMLALIHELRGKYNFITKYKKRQSVIKDINDPRKKSDIKFGRIQM